MNAYDMLQAVRDNVNESTSGVWADSDILTMINAAQRKYAMRLSMQPGNWLVSSVSVAPVSSVITLPSDCAKPLYLEETSSGSPLFFKTALQDRRASRTYGSLPSWDIGSLEAYPQMDAVVVNTSGYATACTLWYQVRVPDLHTGTAAGGGATYIRFQSGAKPLDDYYNNCLIEVVSGTGSHSIDTITDFAKTNLQATVTGTYDNDSVYGTISKLPEECHYLIVLDATCVALAKPSAMVDPKAYEAFRAEKREHYTMFSDWASSRIPGAGRHTRITAMDD